MAKQKSRFPSYGLVRGPSHEQGGVAGMVAGEQPVELEGGEWIIPKEAVPDYLPVLKQITNEGRAMQQMQNGNSAMDALIASASMETGLAQPKSPMFMGGGMMDEYEGGGQLHSRRMYNQKDKKKYGYEMGGMMPEYQDGGRVSVKSKLIDAMSESNGLSKEYTRSDIETLDLNTLERIQDIMMQRSSGDQYSGIEDAFVSSPESADMGERRTYANRFDVRKGFGPEGKTGSSREQVSLGGLPGLSYLANLASKSGVSPESLVGKLFNAPLPLTLEKDIPTGKKSYKLGYSPQYQDGGMIKQYQQGGQMQPRKQQEIRNPQMYGPPDSLMEPDTTMGNLDDLLNYYMESDRRNKLNVLTGDSIDFEADSLNLLKSMDKSKTPRPSDFGGPKFNQPEKKNIPDEENMDVFFPFLKNFPSLYPDYMGPLSPEQQKRLDLFNKIKEEEESKDSDKLFAQEGGMVPNDNLMSSMSMDRRVAPMQADIYNTQSKNGMMVKERIEIPKLSSAYMSSMGVETPLSKRQRSLLQRKAIAPKTLNPQVQSLLGRVLVQRLANEPI